MPKVSNVSAAKPKTGGAVWAAPLGTTLPTDASTELSDSFESLGYISEDGMTNSNSPDSDQVKAWGGDTVLVIQNSKDDTFAAKFIEGLNTAVLKMIYGDSNVSVNSETGLITIKATSEEIEEKTYVIDMILRNGALKRIVIPDGKISELGDIEYSDSDAFGYEATINCVPDANGVSHYEYILPASE